MSQLPFRQQLEEYNNPEEVRQRLAAGNYNPRHACIAQEYLDSLNRKDVAESVTKRDAREEETLLIAKEALSIAKDSATSARSSAASAQSASASAFEQARWAKWAAIAAVIALIISKADDISKLFP